MALKLTLDGTSPSIGHQLFTQGYKYDPEKVTYFEDIRKAISVLQPFGIMPDTVINKCRDKLTRKVNYHLKQFKINKPILNKTA